jgi:uncharacterized RDD family membrane protein YckC
MFNRFVSMYLNSNYFFLKWNKRIKSIILEMLYTLSIFFPFVVILMIPTYIFINTNQTNFVWTDLLSIIPFSLIMVALVNKDIFSGQSVVHRLLGFQVVDYKTNKKASKVKYMLRNITAPLWPIEAIFLLTNPKRRLVDFIAGTNIFEIEPTDPKLILFEIENARFDKDAKLTLIISVIWVVTFILLFDSRLRIW